ncbi:MAG: hypothetical protein AAF789_00705 [Bacteroidota bacterium]
MPEKASKDSNPNMRPYALAFELVVMNIAIIVGGYYADEFLGTSPVCILAGTLLATSGTIWLLIRYLK